jgi:hypothetical protein
MGRSDRVWAAVLALGLGLAGAAEAAWKTCNGVPVRPQSLPLGFVVNGCSIGDNSTPRGRSVIGALVELGEYAPLGKIANWPMGPCRITHGDGQSDVAVTPPSGTDGNPGLTITETDGCTFAWEEEHIEESDVMARSDLDFAEPDQSFVATATTDVGLGRIVLLHESGHGIGLEHTGNYAVMRNGLGARVPYIGGLYGGFGAGNSGHVKFTADDVHSLRSLHGIPQDYPNLFVSGQWLDRNIGRNLIINTDSNAAGVPLTSPQRICPGQTLTVMATVGNVSQFSRSTDLRVYADSVDNCTRLDGVGTELSYWTLSVKPYTTRSFAVGQTIPVSIPRDVPLRIYSAVNVRQSPAGERRAYDDCVRSAATILVPRPAICLR